MIKTLYYSISCFLLASGFALATEQQFYDVGKDEVLEDKYTGYKTTLSNTFRGAFSDDSGLYQNERRRNAAGSRNSSFGFIAGEQGNFGGGLGDYRAQYKGLFDQGELDYGANSFDSMTQGFQSEFRNMFARDDSLIKEFSVPQPSYFNQGFVNQGNSGGNKSGSGAAAGGDKSKNKSAANSYEYVEQPTLISWAFAVIAYIRAHPVITGVIVLVVFLMFSLVQSMIQSQGKPFIPKQGNLYGRRGSRRHGGEHSSH